MDIVEIISTLGFPIGACIYLAWQGQRQDEKFSELIEKNQSVIENNTKAITEFSTKIGK